MFGNRHGSGFALPGFFLAGILAGSVLAVNILQATVNVVEPPLPPAVTLSFWHGFHRINQTPPGIHERHARPSPFAKQPGGGGMVARPSHDLFQQLSLVDRPGCVGPLACSTVDLCNSIRLADPDVIQVIKLVYRVAVQQLNPMCGVVVYFAKVVALRSGPAFPCEDAAIEAVQPPHHFVTVGLADRR